MDWRALLHNRWALGGVGVAGAAGLYVLYRKRKTGGTGGSGGGTSQQPQFSPSYASGSVGSFDSTGTDVAAWLGNYSGNLDNQLKQFKTDLVSSVTSTVNDRLASVEDRLSKIPTGTTGTGTPTTSNTPVASLPSSLTVPAGVNLYDWSQQVERQYGLTTPVFNTIRSQGTVKWGADLGNGYGKMPYFSAPTTVTL